MSVTVSHSNDPVYEQMFDDLIQEVFGFSFAPWFARELWDERYESYSIIQDGRMLSNVCIFKDDMLLYGQTIRAHQFGAVATRKSERGKGLSRLLMEHVLSLYPEVPTFLYANPSVIDFYPRFGFRQAYTYRPRVAVSINNQPDLAVKYDVDDNIVRQSLYGKRIHSEVADSLRAQSIQIFHLLMDYPDGIYFLPGSEAVVIAEQKGHNLFIADVITKKPITFDELKMELPFTGVKRVEFGFCPDWLGVDPYWEPADWEKEPFFLRGEWNLSEKFRFPAMSAT